jgi:hypothetical protein
MLSDILHLNGPRCLQAGPPSQREASKREAEVAGPAWPRP